MHGGCGQEMRVLVTDVSDSGSAPDVGGAPTSAVQASALLAASRRVDWRFLLPDPVLGDVTSVGPLTQTLTDSLQIFSSSLVKWDPNDDRDEDRHRSLYDVAVACDPSRLEVGQMARLVKPGGFIYLEAHGLTSLLRIPQLPARWMVLAQRGLWRPKSYERVLQLLGFTEVQTHWHWPDFEHCKMIIPLTAVDGAAARYAFARRGRRMSAGLGKLLGWSGLLPETVPCFSVLAQRSVT